MICTSLEDRTTETIAQRISHEMRVDSFTLVDEYYVVNKYILADTISALNEGVNNHRIIYPGSAREMYIAFYMPKDKKAANRSLITAVFSNLDYGWKLTRLDLALYSINGKTSPELYKYALQEYSKGYLAAAAYTMQLATNCARPTDTWMYEKEKEIFDFASQVVGEANGKYLYPVVIKQVSTEPLLLGIYSNNADEGTFPMISYQSKIKLSNVEAIKKEQQQIKKVIGQVYPGIDKGRKYLYYAAYNEMPSATKNVAKYEIKDQLN
jgi:hypothetical protein